MRRSEAIYKLREFLVDRKVSSVDTLGALSHSIIKFVEDELGMLPPEIQIKTNNESIFPYMCRNEWGPEDNQ